ncbi:MAG: hypothetical protein ACKV0T_24810 [Planctomycetales bacterium]
MRCKIESQNPLFRSNRASWQVCQWDVEVELFVVFEAAHVRSVAIKCDAVNVFLHHGDSEKVTDVCRGDFSGRSFATGEPVRVLGGLRGGQHVPHCLCEQRLLVEWPVTEVFPQNQDAGAFRKVTGSGHIVSVLRQEVLFLRRNVLEELFDDASASKFEFLHLAVVESARAIQRLDSPPEDPGEPDLSDLGRRIPFGVEECRIEFLFRCAPRSGVGLIVCRCG